MASPRKEELVAAAWREGRADPRVANELDGFMTAAIERLGEEGMRDASPAASSGRRMELPGVGREHQAGLDELARRFVQARDGMALSAARNQLVEREAKEADRVRAEGRERRGCRRSRNRTGVGTEAEGWNGSGTGHSYVAKTAVAFPLIPPIDESHACMQSCVHGCSHF